ncbi:hypothetical protein BH23PAT2_BH23PAT2_06840 [soil metagenome]
MLNLLLIFSAVILLILSAVILFSNPKAPTNRYLSAFMVSGLFWVVANIYANNVINQDSLLLFSRLTIIGSSLSALMFLLFSFQFTNSFDKLSFNKKALISVPIIGLLLTTFSDLNIKADEASDIGISTGLVYYIMIPVLSAYFVYGIYLFTKNYALASYEKKRQLVYIFWGITLSFIPALLLNAIFPLLGYTETAFFGPLSVLFFAVFSTIAIIKHRLLNVRLIVARSIAYSLVVFTLASLYSLIIFSASNAVPAVEPLSVEQLLVATIGSLFLVFTSVPLRDSFNKLSNHLFYRDAYDSQEFLDNLNKVLVTKVDVEPLLNDTKSVINAHLKSSFCAFSIRETQYVTKRMLGDNKKDIPNNDLEKIGKLTSHIQQTVIATDELNDSHAELKEILRNHDITIIARLVTNIEYGTEGVGYMMIGPKQSGSPYTNKDIKIVEIIANELVITIQNALRFEEIEEFNVTLQAKVDDATKKLRHTNEKLEAMDETKDEFISMASHQLRTPLTSVKGYLSMVLEGDAGEIKPMQEKLLSQAFISSQRMVYLIADLLNVSRLRTGKFVIESIKTNLASVVQGEVDQLKETAGSRNLELTYDKPESFPDLMLDETKVRQVVMNFIDNAIYYTPAGGKIAVKLVEKGDSVEYTVTDDGIGVPKNDQQHLFTKFYRAGNARKARPDGTGLGLFMAKKVVIAQGGAVIFKSKEGEGSTLGFTLPKAKLLPQSIEAEPTQNT